MVPCIRSISARDIPMALSKKCNEMIKTTEIKIGPMVTNMEKKCPFSFANRPSF